MSTLAEIEETIAKLSPEEFRELLRRLNERDAKDWDRQIAEDSKAGALDVLIQEVSDDIAQGKVRLIDEVCRDK